MRGILVNADSLKQIEKLANRAKDYETVPAKTEAVCLLLDRLEAEGLQELPELQILFDRPDCQDVRYLNDEGEGGLKQCPTLTQNTQERISENIGAFAERGINVQPRVQPHCPRSFGLRPRAT